LGVQSFFATAFFSTQNLQTEKQESGLAGKLLVQNRNNGAYG